jgi:type I restriction enzyme, S subunit
MSYVEKLLKGAGVEWKALGQIAEIKTGKGVTKKDSSDKEEYPIISGGKEPMGFIDKFNRPGNTVTISRVGANAGFVNFIINDFYLNDKCFSIKPIDSYKDRIHDKYLYYFLKSIEQNIIALQSEGGVPTINTGKVSSLQIPIPYSDHPKTSLEIQQEIVRILDAFTELTAELTAELSAELIARKKQYQHYQAKLLSFKNGEIEWKPLGEVYKFQYGIGNTIPTSGGKYPVYGSNGIVGTHSEYNSEDSPVIGHIGAYAGIVNWGKGKHFVTYNGVICKLVNETVNSRYGYYQLLNQDFHSLAKNSSQPFVSYKELNAVQIPIPSLIEQERIVLILDKFDMLTNSIRECLQKEVELRKKQYEYYRDLLLTFPKNNIES